MGLEKVIVACGGNRAVLIIPVALAESMDLCAGARVDLTIKGNSLMVTPMVVKP